VEQGFQRREDHCPELVVRGNQRRISAFPKALRDAAPPLHGVVERHLTLISQNGEIIGPFIAFKAWKANIGKPERMLVFLSLHTKMLDAFEHHESRMKTDTTGE